MCAGENDGDVSKAQDKLDGGILAILPSHFPSLQWSIKARRKSDDEEDRFGCLQALSESDEWIVDFHISQPWFGWGRRKTL